MLDNCGSPGDAPVSWTAQTSMNGTNFTTVASGRVDSRITATVRPSDHDEADELSASRIHVASF